MEAVSFIDGEVNRLRDHRRATSTLYLVRSSLATEPLAGDKSHLVGNPERALSFLPGATCPRQSWSEP